MSSEDNVLWTKKRLLRTIDVKRVQDAIVQAERLTSGEIRVSVARFFWGDIRKVAWRAFERLGMVRTAQRNGVLFFIVPSRRRFVVIGDEGIHEKVGSDFWGKVVLAVSSKFRSGDFTGGLVEGIATVGHELAAYFPYDAASDRNELPDAVDFGGEA
ncbi:MAG: TPM domain-containing protein [Vicinamibacteria bacterium]|nr:TPM domain-containing protein [Vicinamibacteria bacterium]